MKNCIFEVTDKTGRKIRMTGKQWSHTLRRHSYITRHIEEIKETLKKPDKLIIHQYNKGYYYRHYKYLKKPNKFVLVVVKYLNGDGFIITAYFEERIRWT